MASCFGSENRLKSRVSPNTATLGLALLSTLLNVSENCVGDPLDGSASSMTRTVRGSGCAIDNGAANITNKASTSARISIANARWRTTSGVSGYLARKFSKFQRQCPVRVTGENIPSEDDDSACPKCGHPHDRYAPRADIGSRRRASDGALGRNFLQPA